MLTLNQTLYINNVPAKGKFFMLDGTGTLHLKVIQIQCACIKLCTYNIHAPVLYYVYADKNRRL